MEDRSIDIAELDDALRTAIQECEVSGRRTRFVRDGRDVALVVSRDEYVAMRETLDIAGDDDLLRELATSDADLARNAIILPEDLLVE